MQPFLTAFMEKLCKLLVIASYTEILLLSPVSEDVFENV